MKKPGGYNLYRIISHEKLQRRKSYRLTENLSYKREFYYYETNKYFDEEMRERSNFNHAEMCNRLSSVNELNEYRCN